MKTPNQFQISFANYSQLLQETNFIQYGDIKGTLFFTPQSFWLWTQIQKFLDQRFSQLKVENVAFPSFITAQALAKEKHHVAGFKPEILKITHVGDQKLAEEFYLRPTSEVVFGHYFHLVVKSYRDLPLLLNQWVNVWRWEQNPKPFFRNIEFLWQEGHTLHVNANDSSQFCQKIFQIYQELINQFLLIPTFSGQKSELEKFAGAQTSYALETLMPDGQFLQLATVHDLAQNFTRAFDVKFLTISNQLTFPYQTSWAISTRLLAGLIMTHMDKYGLKFPTKLTKTQIVLFGFFKKKMDLKVKKQLQQYLIEIQTSLNQYRIHYFDLSTSKKSLSYWQNYYWKRGVILQLVISNVECESKNLTYLLRSQPTVKKICSFQQLNETLSFLFDSYDDYLRENAQNFQTSRLLNYSDYSKYQSAVKNAAFCVPFCGQKTCENAIKKDTGTISRILNELQKSSKCFHCQKPAKFSALFGRCY